MSFRHIQYAIPLEIIDQGQVFVGAAVGGTPGTDCHSPAVKTPVLRGLKDTPTYFHDGRLMTLDDTVEFFNLILGTKLTPQEKKDLVAFMLTL